MVDSKLKICGKTFVLSLLLLVITFHYVHISLPLSAFEEFIVYFTTPGVPVTIVLETYSAM